jgi:hypothetical protein
MDNRVIDIEVLQDQQSLNVLSAALGSEGRLLVCHRCLDVTEVIAGILIMHESEEAWVVCGPCLRQLPLQGCLAS